MLECLCGAPEGSFGGPRNFEKLTFPKKGHSLKSTRYIKISKRFSAKALPLKFWGPSNFANRNRHKSPKRARKADRAKKDNRVFWTGAEKGPPKGP